MNYGSRASEMKVSICAVFSTEREIAGYVEMLLLAKVDGIIVGAMGVIVWKHSSS